MRSIIILFSLNITCLYTIQSIKIDNDHQHALTDSYIEPNHNIEPSFDTDHGFDVEESSDAEESFDTEPNYSTELAHNPELTHNTELTHSNELSHNTELNHQAEPSVNIEPMHHELLDINPPSAAAQNGIIFANKQPGNVQTFQVPGVGLPIEEDQQVPFIFINNVASESGSLAKHLPGISATEGSTEPPTEEVDQKELSELSMLCATTLGPQYAYSPGKKACEPAVEIASEYETLIEHESQRTQEPIPLELSEGEYLEEMMF